jgi:hypothetical protein
MSANKLTFKSTPTVAFTELRLTDNNTVLPVASWALSGHPGAGLCQRLIVEEVAIEEDDALFVEHAAIGRLTAEEARKLDMPPATALRAVVEGNGIMLRPEFAVSLRWVRSSGQPVLGVTRIGAWLSEAEGWRRLPETVFTVAEAVDAHAIAAKEDEGTRLRAVARLREALPAAATAGTADAAGILGTATIIEADAFSLETIGEGDALQLVPVLHRAGAGDAPLLPEDRQRAFGAEQFHRWPGARSVYALPGGVYVTVSPPLRRALDVVRKAASAPIEHRRALLREPRPAIREAIGDEADSALIESLLVETRAWSDRVIALGLWKPRVLPWISLQANDWFGGNGETDAAREPKPRGIQVGDRCLPLTRAQAAALTERVIEAIDHGKGTIVQETEEGPVTIPATRETLDALATLVPRKTEGVAEPALMPIIKPNETEVDSEAFVQRRAAPLIGLPSCLATTLKPHQLEGLIWLQKSWISGSPGVLLADDMGLGKTLQGLAFLAWLRDGMQAGIIARHPLLIVAPTGLLENWRAEHDRHLAPPGLGRLLPAYGKGLAALRKSGVNAMPSLDLSALSAADWVLTTYETLRDYSRDFVEMHCAAMLVDEAQKIKTPAIRMTDAAKAMNADFRIALTGTPVENRLADLWCIIDGVAPGHLGDLRRFSARYEGPNAAVEMPALKASLDQPLGGRPRLLMRRLKEDRLPELPQCEQIVIRAPMSGRQASAYQDAIEKARDDRGGGRVLEALHRLRQVSLCPDCPDDAADTDVIKSSARLAIAIKSLDRIHAAGESALIFLDDLAVMARLSGLLQRRYKLENAPMTISGKVPGPSRQARVDLFQCSATGFDVMLLSPRAGGVGLTLTRANHVMHLARWWNPAVEDQATARAHRIGQDRQVFVHIPLAVLADGRPSFDENLHALLERKRFLMRNALLPPEPSSSELATMLDNSLST